MHARIPNPASLLPALFLVLPGNPPSARAAAGSVPSDSSAIADSSAAGEGTSVAGSVAGAAASFVETFVRDLATQGTYPVRVAHDRPAWFLGGCAGFALLVATDPETHDFLHPEWIEGSDFQQGMQNYSDLVTTRNAAIVVAGFGAVGIAAGSARERDTAVLLTRALGSTTVWTGVLKYLAARQRPRETSGYHSDWTGPGGVFADPGDDTKYRSFVSGHASNSWALATVLAHQYPAHHIVPVAAYAGAAVMCYARVVVNAHWLSDVVVGGVVGYGCARQVIASQEARRAAAPARTGWRIDLDADPHHAGVGLVYAF